VEKFKKFAYDASSDGDDDDDSDADDDDDDGDDEDNDDSDDDGDESDSGTHNCNYTGKDIEKAILRSLESKVKNGWSREETLSEMRNLFELLKDERIPHKSWNAMMKYIRKLGYKDPTHVNVCCGTDHVRLLQYKEDCPICGQSWKNSIKYYVLGIHLENYFLSEDTIKDHLQHWENKNEWLGDDLDEDVKHKEMWHGERFKELSYFWDDSVETFLPVLCPNCDTVMSVKEMAALVLPGNTLHDQLCLCCNECMFDFVHQPKKMRGCPLNQAFIFHEDGFNAFEKKSRSISAIHISSACINKEQRSNGKYMRVYSFIPTVFLGEGISHKMDAFLKPLINEVKDLYINGINVNIKQQINLKNGIAIQPGSYQVRMLLFCGTADLKGHQEIILYAGGKSVYNKFCVLLYYYPIKK
jgi:hypothetical protein